MHTIRSKQFHERKSKCCANVGVGCFKRSNILFLLGLWPLPGKVVHSSAPEPGWIGLSWVGGWVPNFNTSRTSSYPAARMAFGSLGSCVRELPRNSNAFSLSPCWRWSSPTVVRSSGLSGENSRASCEITQAGIKQQERENIRA